MIQSASSMMPDMHCKISAENTKQNKELSIIIRVY